MVCFFEKWFGLCMFCISSDWFLCVPSIFSSFDLHVCRELLHLMFMFIENWDLAKPSFFLLTFSQLIRIISLKIFSIMLLCLIIDHNVICYVGLCFIVRMFCIFIEESILLFSYSFSFDLYRSKKKKSISFNLYLGDVEVEIFFLRIMSKLKSPNNK